MATRKTANARSSKTATAPARKLALKKDGLKDLGAKPKSSGVKGGANFSRAISGAF